MKDNKNSAVITSAARTVIGSFEGSLSNLQGHELGAVAIQEVLKRSKIKPSNDDALINLGNTKKQDFRLGFIHGGKENHHRLGGTRRIPA